MNSNLLKIFFSTDKKKQDERRQKRKYQMDAEKEKAKTERKLWELAEEYEEE